MTASHFPTIPSYDIFSEQGGHAEARNKKARSDDLTKGIIF